MSSLSLFVCCCAVLLQLQERLYVLVVILTTKTTNMTITTDQKQPLTWPGLLQKCLPANLLQSQPNCSGAGKDTPLLRRLLAASFRPNRQHPQNPAWKKCYRPSEACHAIDFEMCSDA
jgi:hypothetical protein